MIAVQLLTMTLIMAKGDDIQERLVDLAVSLLKLVSTLPKDDTGKHISKQLLRSGTSPAANYSEARAAESRKDFVHKLKISLKELNETAIWLLIIEKSQLMDKNRVAFLRSECNELSRILNASIRTTLINAKAKG